MTTKPSYEELEQRVSEFVKRSRNIKQGLPKVAERYGTKLFTTNPRYHDDDCPH